MAHPMTTFESIEVVTNPVTRPPPWLLKSKPLEAARVEALCQQRLSQSPYVALRYLLCSFHEGILTMRGNVPTYHMKQLAYITLRDVPGVQQVADRIEVPCRAAGPTRGVQR